MGRKPQVFGIIGLGNFGMSVAGELVRFGNHVIGVDIDEKVVSTHADTLTQSYIADGRDDDALRDAGLENCSAALVAVGTSFESSVLASINLKMIGVEKVWAKAESKAHHRILSKIGVDRVVHPAREMGQHIAQVLHNHLVRDYVSLGNGYHVVNFIVPKSLTDTPLARLALQEEFNLRCLGVMRGTKYIASEGRDFILSADDRLLLLGQRDALRAFTESL